MNLAIVSAFAAVLFFASKMALHYSDPSPTAYIQDAVLTFVTCAAGLYIYQNYFDKPSGTKVPVVFTERPNF
jgi:hypothetical protein